MPTSFSTSNLSDRVLPDSRRVPDASGKLRLPKVGEPIYESDVSLTLRNGIVPVGAGVTATSEPIDSTTSAPETTAVAESAAAKIASVVNVTAEGDATDPVIASVTNGNGAGTLPPGLRLERIA